MLTLIPLVIVVKFKTIIMLTIGCLALLIVYAAIFAMVNITHKKQTVTYQMLLEYSAVLIMTLLILLWLRS